MNEYRTDRSIAVISLMLAAIFIGFIVFMQINMSKIVNEAEKQQEQQEQMIRELEENADDYTFFLDGEIVDIDTVDLNQYEISVSEEAHKVFLTNKAENERNSRTLFWPVFLPW